MLGLMNSTTHRFSVGQRPTLERQQNMLRKRRNSQPYWKVRRSVLHHRLKELLVFEIHRDGNRQYRNMTLRSLYNYVLKGIATKPRYLLKSKSVASKINDDSVAAPTELVHDTSRGIRRPTVGTEKIIKVLQKADVRQKDKAQTSGESRAVFKDDDSISLTFDGGNSSISSTITERASKFAPPVVEISNDMFGHKSHGDLLGADGGDDDAGAGAGADYGVDFDQSEMHDSFPLPRRPDSSLPSKEVRARMVAFEETKSQKPTVSRTISEKSLSEVTYRERLGGYLHPRDMRRLVTPFSTSNQPELIVRRHVMLLNFDPLRAIVLRDRLLVIVPDGSDSILETLAKRIRGGLNEVEDAVFMDRDLADISGAQLNDRSSSKTISAAKIWPGKKSEMKKVTEGFKGRIEARRNLNHRDSRDTISDDDVQRSVTAATIDNYPFSLNEAEFDDLEHRDWIDLPFELRCVDAVLHVVTNILTKDANDIQEYGYNSVEALLSAEGGDAETGQDILRWTKREIAEVDARCTGFIQAINKLLDDDEDMALMNLTRLITHPDRFIQPVSEEILHAESDEPELILEAYLQQTLNSTNALELLKNELTTAEDMMTMQLDTIRNRLLYMNTLVSLLSLAVAVGSFIGAVFGMNLTNGLEEDPNAFVEIVIGTIVGSLGFLTVMLLAFRRASVLSSVS